MARAVFGLVLVLVMAGCHAAEPTRKPARTSAPAVLEATPSEPAPEPVMAPEPAPEPAPETAAPPAIDGDVIRRIVRSHTDAIRACYELRPDLDPVLAARIEISFTIGPTGAVTEAKAEPPEDFPYPEVPTCIADELRTWTFPAPRGGGSVIVSYPRT